ncbi:MAG: peptidylprolyl isomerase, partial [Oscillospiraceae bacterium]|nr:peptidylprolyl isomerase [Oscillospiraceae bacterium]
MQQQSNSYPKSRTEIAAEIRSQFRLDMDRRFRELSSELVKNSGGMIKLRRVLEGRGMSYRDWQERLRRKAFTYSYLNMIIKPRAPTPGPKAIQEYYARHGDEFRLPGLVRFRHIFFSREARGGDEAARNAVSEVWGMLTGGEIDLASAASRYSDDKPSAGRGGLETDPEAADPEREAWLADIRIALREETPGKLAPILESTFGYHLAELISIAPDVKIPFREVRGVIERKLEAQVFQAEVDKYYATKRKSTNIKVFMPNFPQQLSCAAQQVRPQDVPAIYKLGEVGIPG